MVVVGGQSSGTSRPPKEGSASGRLGTHRISGNVSSRFGEFIKNSSLGISAGTEPHSVAKTRLAWNNMCGLGQATVFTNLNFRQQTPSIRQYIRGKKGLLTLSLVENMGCKSPCSSAGYKAQDIFANPITTYPVLSLQLSLRSRIIYASQLV